MACEIKRLKSNFYVALANTDVPKCIELTEMLPPSKKGADPNENHLSSAFFSYRRKSASNNECNIATSQ
ncbi:hypothetical protein FHS30_000911 [Simiduia aestuariiviva]|uniref:Uncharacterized protein n=1 Tax=Simiduia aestuariiviva TaxID=1510459 RepID=A0A839UQT7_9GAMM|nr:hypothetical protein [Simiduia aestuariiviva]